MSHSGLSFYYESIRVRNRVPISVYFNAICFNLTFFFRISPTSTSHVMSNTDTLLNGDEPVSTLTQDFHTRLDNLLRTLVHAKPHFVRCIAPNVHDSDLEFDRTHVTNQVRSLQVLETVNLMARGFPHRMRFKAFNAR